MTVATVVEREGRFLMVEETTRGKLVFNQPAGHLEPNETLVQAALRETLEETGWTVELEHLLGAYQWSAPSVEDGGTGRQYLRFAFVARPVSHDPLRELDKGIEQALWLSRSEIESQLEKLRSPLVLRALNDYWNGARHPLHVLGHEV